MWTKGWRESTWAQLDRKWDIIIIGGGITGAGILQEATRHHMRALLIEAKDFASGTSSRSSKLVHGGLRYLRNGQIRTTIASVHERERLLREGRGLVNPLGFLFVSFAGDKTSLPLLGFGLAIYDLLGLRWGHKRYHPPALARLVPNINEDRLKGGYRYFDAQTDDARLVLRVIDEGLRAGGTALNYARVERLLTKGDGQVCGVAVKDVARPGSQRTVEVQAKVVVNATGAAADSLRRQVGGHERLRCLRGSHLVFPAQRFPLFRAVSFAHPVDGRPVLAIPWEGVTLFGTTDVDHVERHGLDPVISQAEIDYLMTAVSYGFPALGLTESSVQSTFAGVRAVVNTGKRDPSKESREHVLWDENGLLTVTGGKLTTFQAMARDALRIVRGRLPSGGSGNGRPPEQRMLDTPSNDLPEVTLDRASRLRLLGRYGQHAQALVEEAVPTELATIAGSLNLWAELRWAARSEAVVHLDDLLLRRVRLGLLLPEGGLPWMSRIRSIVQPELGWDDRRWREEVTAYTCLWRSAYSPPCHS